MNIEVTSEQAIATRYALLLHTKEDSLEFPSARVKLIREFIHALDTAIVGELDEQEKKQNDEWSYEKTKETEEAIKRLHETIRMRKLKEHDDKMGYETGGK